MTPFWAKLASVSSGAAATLSLLCALCLGWVVGCEVSAKEKMREANAALLGGDPDRAKVALDEAIAKDATLQNVPLLRGRIFMAKKQFEKAEQEFLQVWESHDLSKTDGLGVEQKRQKRILEDELWPELYLGWAGTLDGKQNPQKYEEILAKGLGYEPKNNRMNKLLVEFYAQQAERLIEQGKRGEAATMLGQIDRLRTTSARRDAARSRAQKLEQEIFLEAAAKRFETEMLPELKTAGLWDADKKAVVVVTKAELDRNLREEQWQAQGRAGLGAQVEHLIRRVGGFGKDTVIPPGAQPQGFEVIEESFKRGTYQAKGRVPIKEITVLTLEIKEFRDARAAEEGEGERENPAPAQDTDQPEADDSGGK